MSALTVNIFVPDYKKPILTKVEVFPVSTSVAVKVRTDENTGFTYTVADSQSIHTAGYVVANGTATPVTHNGQQDTISISGLTANTDYYAHTVHVDEQNNISNVVTREFQTPSPEAGLVVYDDAQLVAAITDGIEGLILIAPGIYTTADLVDGANRVVNPLTLRGQNPHHYPIFLDAPQRLRRTHHVTFQYIWAKNSGILDGGKIMFDDGGFSGFQNGCSNITVRDCKISSPEPEGIYDKTPTATFSVAMCTAFRFANWQTHDYNIIGNDVNWVHQIGDIMFNGTVNITHNVVVGWYFDGIRFLGNPAEGRIPGNKILAYNDFSACVGGYNEVTSKSPHPDWLQGFNSGSDVNNTDPHIRDLLVYRNRFCPGNYRSRSIQSGLTQTRMVNTGYIQNIFCSEGNIHGISLEGGSDGVLIEHNTIVEHGWNNYPMIRTFYGTGQVMVNYNFYGVHNTLAYPNPRYDRPSFEFDEGDNRNGYYGYTDTFQGLPYAADIVGLVESFRPKPAYAQYGAITVDGIWKDVPHAPLTSAEVPIMIAGTGQFTVGTIPEPTLMTDYQSSLGGDVYIRRDLRYSIADSNAWTVLTDVASTSSHTVPAGDYYVQTRCVNTAGPGLWSPKATVTILP